VVPVHGEQGEHTGRTAACMHQQLPAWPACRGAPARQSELKPGPCCTVIYLLASAGDLERALRRGVLHTRRSRRPRLQPLLALALDVAGALAYLHDPVVGLVRARACLPCPRRTASPGAVAGAAWPALGPFNNLPRAPGCQARIVAAWSGCCALVKSVALVCCQCRMKQWHFWHCCALLWLHATSAREDAEWRGARGQR